jgi:diketogulonate reductase-like aldo/keto reductase
MQIHNLVDWKTHLKTLKEYKEAGRIRYIGITHYTDEMHEELEKIINNETIDFVQFNYSISNRNAEKRLLPACADRGVATIINKPFGTGELFEKVKNAKLPEWCEEQGISYWSQFFLKYLIGHLAVTCIIPATADKDHMRNNADAGNTPLPDQHILSKMAEFIDGMN